MKNLYLFGDSPSSTGRGGTGVSSTGIGLFNKNPASIAEVKDAALGIQYGASPLYEKFYNPDISAGFPTTWGVFGTSFRALIIPESTDFNYGYGINAGWGRDFSEALKLGASVNLFYACGENRNYYAGAALGGIYRFKTLIKGERFGIFTPSAGWALNIGAPMGEKSRQADFNGLTIGYDFLFYQNEKFNAGIYNEISYISGYGGPPVKIGLESRIYDRFIIRGGAIVGNVYGYGDFSLGGGYRFKNDSFNGGLDYALVRNSGRIFSHYLGLNIAPHSEDREPPSVKIIPDKIHISPNDDGIQDFARFALDAADKSRIKGWKLAITDTDGRVIRVYKKFSYHIKKLTLMEAAAEFLSKRESRVVPGFIIWDGKDYKGRSVPDGRYSYAFNVWDEWDNIADMKKGDIYVDTDPPKAGIKTPNTAYNYADAENKKIIIEQEIKTAPDDKWQAGIRNSAGLIIKNFNWAGSNVPKKLLWDARDDTGGNAPDGAYEYFLNGRDSAGNSASDILHEIIISKTPELIELKTNSRYFSYLNKKSLKIIPLAKNKNGLASWKISILKKDKTIREYHGGTDLPKEIEWDCLDAAGRRLHDGVYTVKIIAGMKDGRSFESAARPIFFDSTLPRPGISLSAKMFSPDGDGEDDHLLIKTSIDGRKGIKRWAVNIYSHSGKLFRSFSGIMEIPDEILWNGLGAGGEEPESAIDYFIQMEAEDAAGNSSLSAGAVVMTDFLVIPVYRGFRIQAGSLRFEYNTPALMTQSIPLLDRIHEKIEKYKDYEILIHAHVNSMESEEKNLELSEMRAETIGNYLADKGLDKKRIRTSGMGETNPVYRQNMEDNIRRSQRIEFFILQREE